MRSLTFLWTDDAGEGNATHVAEHGVDQDEFEYVVTFPKRGPEVSRSNSENLVVWGYTSSGRYLMAVYLEIDPVTIYPITAYDAEPPNYHAR